MGLTFDVLRTANTQRGVAPLYPENWLQNIISNLGKYANVQKDFNNGKLTREVYKKAAACHISDVIILLDCLTNTLAIDLSREVVSTFNATSRTNGSSIFIAGEGWSVIKETRPGTLAGEILFLDGKNTGEKNAAAVDYWKGEAENVDKLRYRNYELRCKIMELEKQNREQKEQADARINDLQAKLIGAAVINDSSTIEALRSDNEDLRATNIELSCRLENMQKGNASMKRHIDSQVHEIAGHLNQIERLKITVHTHERRYDNLVAKNESLNNRIKDLCDTVTRTAQGCNELKDKLKAIANISKEPDIEIKVNTAGDGLTARRTGGCNNFGSNLPYIK